MATYLFRYYCHPCSAETEQIPHYHRYRFCFYVGNLLYLLSAGLTEISRARIHSAVLYHQIQMRSSSVQRWPGVCCCDDDGGGDVSSVVVLLVVSCLKG